MNYFDTSALVKLFVEERGSELMVTLVERTPSVATAKIAYVEVQSALVRRHRVGALSGPQLAIACRQFAQEWQRYVRVDLRDDVLEVARGLVRRHALRAYDAVHLASAVNLRQSLGEEIRFVAADKPLLRAAEAEGCAVLDAETAAAE